MHTVEKIGGTSMSRHQEVLENLWLRSAPDLYRRIFVVSAYAGITDSLLEHKKTGESGVYAHFASASNGEQWQVALDKTLSLMLDINQAMFAQNDVLCRKANNFVQERINGARACLEQIAGICAYGPFQLSEYLQKVRELLAGLGEAHSAFNSVLLLREHNVNACFVDLTGWEDEQVKTLDALIDERFSGMDLTSLLPIVTGYAQCQEGLMRSFDRGYSEMTFSRIACRTQAKEAIIHKEYHLSTADPAIVPVQEVCPIGSTNYDVADQLANLGMEAIHPRAAKGMRQQKIPLRVKNTFEPEHKGTLIHHDYVSEKPCVEIIAGSRNVFALEVFDQDMTGDNHYTLNLNEMVAKAGLRILTKDVNANTFSFYLQGSLDLIRSLLQKIEENYPDADVTLTKVAMVAAIGSNMKVPGILNRAVQSLAAAGVNILSIHQAMRQVDILLAVPPTDYETAVKALHRGLIDEAQLRRAG